MLQAVLYTGIYFSNIFQLTTRLCNLNTQIKKSIRRTHLNIKLHSIKITYSWRTMKEDNHYYYLGIQLIVNMQLTARFVALPKDSCRRRCRGAKRQHIAGSTDSFSPSLFGRCAPVCHSTQLWSHKNKAEMAQTLRIQHKVLAAAHSTVVNIFSILPGQVLK